MGDGYGLGYEGGVPPYLFENTCNLVVVGGWGGGRGADFPPSTVLPMILKGVKGRENVEFPLFATLFAFFLEAPKSEI